MPDLAARTVHRHCGLLSRERRLQCATRVRHTTVEPPPDPADDARVREFVGFFVWARPYGDAKVVERTRRWEAYEVIGMKVMPVLGDSLLQAAAAVLRRSGLPREVESGLRPESHCAIRPDTRAPPAPVGFEAM